MNTPDIKIITWGDTKTIEKDGEEQVVSMYIPQCCREGWDSCVHTVKKQKKAKRNIGL